MIFTGIAIVIDDKIGQEPAIDNLITQINKHKMPCLKYDHLPEIDTICHFSGISFILLDWKLYSSNIGSDISEVVSLPDTARESYIEESINFLKALIKKCFVPIFIFTNESKVDVINELRSHDLYGNNGCDRIFVKEKYELSGKSNSARTLLFSSINKWAERNPSVYVLKIWEKEYQKAKNKLFNDFFKISPYWPQILWKTFIEDGGNKSLELSEIITRNIYTRMSPFEFPDEILKKRCKKKTSPKEMRKVLEGERFITKDDLHDDLIKPGDIFIKSSGKIYLNIRPACDTISRDGNDITLYLLTGYKLKPKQEKDIYNEKYGNFYEQHNQAIVMSIQGAMYNFKFKDLEMIAWNSLKDKRIGRLLPPFTTSIQQRYALYLQRQGLPRIPKMVFNK